MKIISWNINGIRSRVFNNRIASELKKNETITPIDGSAMMNLITQEDPDIICLQETRCSIETSKIINIHGFFQYFNESKLEDARGPNRYSGTAIYTKTKPNLIEYQVDNYNDVEGRIIIMYFDKFILINIYAPNSGTNYDNKIIFQNAFLKYFQKQTVPIVFCGDFNIAIDTHFDQTKVKPSPGIYIHELNFYHTLKTNGFSDTMSPDDDIKYTWWDPRCKKENGMSIMRNRNKGWRIDYFLTRGIILNRSQVKY